MGNRCVNRSALDRWAADWCVEDVCYWEQRGNRYAGGKVCVGTFVCLGVSTTDVVEDAKKACKSWEEGGDVYSCITLTKTAEGEPNAAEGTKEKVKPVNIHPEKADECENV